MKKRAARSERIQLGSLPADLRDVLMREFVPYSVGLASISVAEPVKFIPLGSGTLVQKNGRIGILTADHCLRGVRAAKRTRQLIHAVLRGE